MQRLLVFNETVITMSVTDNAFTSDFVFSSDQGLRFAFAITAYDDNPESIEDPRYGQVKAKYVSWGLKDGSQGGIDNDRYLDIHTCT